MGDGSEPTRLVWTSELVKRFWDYTSAGAGHYFAEAHGRAIATLLKREVARSGDILDYGCGTGGLIDHLLRDGFRVAGLDFSPQSVEKVSDRFLDRDGFLGAALPHDFAERQFDAVVCSEVVEHLYDPELSATLAQIHDLLKPGGLLFLTTPNEEDLAANEVFCPVSEVVFHRWQHVRTWSRESIEGVLVAHAFEVVRTRACDLGGLWAISRRNWLAHKVKRVLGSRSTPPHLIAVARKPPGG